MSNTPPPDPSHPRVLGDLCRVGTNMEDADFWLIRVHSIDKVGTPVKTYSPEYIGIKVVATDVLLPQYLYYVFMHLQASGAWRQLAKGSQNRVNIRVEDVKRIPLARQNPSLEDKFKAKYGGYLAERELRQRQLEPFTTAIARGLRDAGIDDATISIEAEGSDDITVQTPRWLARFVLESSEAGQQPRLAFRFYVKSANGFVNYDREIFIADDDERFTDVSDPFVKKYGAVSSQLSLVQRYHMMAFALGWMIDKPALSDLISTSSGVLRVPSMLTPKSERVNPSVPVGTHPDLFRPRGPDTDVMVDLEGEELNAWARDKKPLDIAKLENAEEVWDALDEGTRERVLENNTAARAELVTDIIAQKKDHWEYQTTGDGGGNTLEYLFHGNNQLSDLAESAMESDEARELLQEPGYAHITAEILMDVLEDTDMYDMGWHSHAEHRNTVGHTKAVGDDNVWPDGMRDDQRDLDANEEGWTSPSGIFHLTLYGMLKRIDFSGPKGEGVTGEGEMLCDELEKHGVYVYSGNIKHALGRLETSRYASISFDYSAPDGHFYADVIWDKVREKLDEDHPAPEPEAPAIPVTPRGIDFLMPTHAEMLASGDDEHLKYRFGLWILDKKQWDAERNYQRREITRLKQAQAHKKKMLWPERNPIVMRFPNGSYVAELNPGPNDEDGGTMREESRRMSHCIGKAQYGYVRAVREGQMRAFSLRTDEGQSVYTFEARPASGDRGGKIVGFPQIKTYKNNLPTGDGVAGRNNAKLAVDTMDNLKNAIEFVKSFGVDPSTVPDFYEAKYRHPELFKRQNPHHGYGHDDGPKPMYSFDEPWYPRDGDGAGAGAVRQNPEPMYSFDEPWYPRS